MTSHYPEPWQLYPMPPEQQAAIQRYVDQFAADRDRLAGIVAEIGDAISPTGERPAEALNTLADDVRALVDAHVRLCEPILRWDADPDAYPGGAAIVLEELVDLMKGRTNHA